MGSEKRASSTKLQPRTARTKPRPSVADYAFLEELSFVRREAQAEANLAYRDWLVQRSCESYLVYRAAQDRADAAQDQLAGWASQIGRGLGERAASLEAMA